MRSDIILRLGGEEGVVEPLFFCHQGSVGTFLHYLALVKYGDLIAELARGEPVGDIDGGFVLQNRVEALIDLRLGYGIQGCRGLIEDDKGGVAVKCPRQGDFLRLAAGDVHAVLLSSL